MNVPLLWRTVTQSCYQLMLKTPIHRHNVNLLVRSMHCICSNKPLGILPKIATSNLSQSSDLLQANTPSIIQNCGMKIRGLLKLRCKDCYFVVRQERMFVFCKSKPRHKQMSMVKRKEKTWILSHATQGPQRAW
ncbi:39S ribosomal protein L36, mitochondrial [Athalia rosae]|uniref:39S ribosomal protein L36, mitochondrial n=1 Tax=Athalia rosae TaxID=37344 RepID=UPI0020336FFA|nr:39S ribosomal protein L36, mitochondrial [Athalia rosae]